MAEGGYSFHGRLNQNHRRGYGDEDPREVGDLFPGQRREEQGRQQYRNERYHNQRNRPGGRGIQNHNNGSFRGGRGGSSRGRGDGFSRGRGDGVPYRRGQRGRGGFRGRRGRREKLGLDAENIRQLRDLLQKDPSTIVMTLIHDSGIGKLLSDDDIELETMLFAVSLLAKACKCTTTPSNVNQILLTVHNSLFYERVTDVFNDWESLDDDDEKREFLKGLLIFLTELFTRLPHSFLDVKVLGVETLLKVQIDEMEKQSYTKEDEMRKYFEQLQTLKETVRENIEQKQMASQSEKERQPPNNFRRISIFPTVEDLQEQPYLRANKASGGYVNLDHYLDVQFRLLREDFIAPLRDGIEEYLISEGSGKQKNKPKDIRVYTDVSVLRTVCTDGGLLHRLRFDVSRLKRVRWENSKRLIYGSLLCLSNDNFQTFFLATVMDRDPKQLKTGSVDVLFEINDAQDIDPEEKFVMVETSAFFEAYRHVLLGLQMINEGDLPFEKYIVLCQTTVKAPKYLDGKSMVGYDLRPLADEEIVLREDANLKMQGREVSYPFSPHSQQAAKVHILYGINWPGFELLHLDESQMKALKTALTKEMTIIQGPPGTGKTYVGLKIVKALLHNAKVWKSRGGSPMLIVCYTNHALDQFMEGIISFFNGNVIRVGSRISNEGLEQYSLKVQRRIARKSEERGMRTVRQNRYDLRKTILDLKLEIEGTGYRLEAAEKTILHEDALQPYMQHHYTIMFKGMQWMHHDLELQMQQRFEFPHSFMVEWLGVGSFDNMMPEEQAEEKYDDDEEEEDDGLDVPEEADIEQSQRKIQDIDEFDILFPDNDLAVLERKIENLKHSQSQYVALDVSKFGRELQGQGGFQFQKQERKRMKRRLLSQLHDAERMTEYERRQIQDPWFLPMNQRWRLYRYWVHKYCKRLRDTVRRKENLYKEAIKKLKELQMVEDKQIFEDAAVIGMTTTAAARYQQALTELGPKIIVVEEAAEVLEGHIITTLSKKCEHLILIGDHKQLKPNPTVYKLAKRYNLDLSLFERMVNNGVHCDTLALQHRMRPEISCIMRHIYPDLQDHPCVTKYENVKGISSNVFFIDHTNPEEHDNDLFSHSNQYEADYIVALCDYLLKQGYDRSRITVLTTYSGQLFKLKKMMPKSQYEGLRLTVVDNYQGEENDIILLSLVRSNEMGSVGFLKIENRVCVALSRAKIGLFVIGNFELLAQNSQLWTEIWRDLRKKGQIGKTLHLYCQNHQADEGISVNSPEDFGKAPEGGCLKPCTFRLDCGHVCRLRCHPYDPQHKEYECRQPCLRSSCTDIKKHPCTRLCYQDCGDCMVKIKKLIPKCGHTQMVPCSVEPEDFSCQEACETILECGHRCGNACWMKHQCTQIVPKTFRCGHTGNVACATQDEAECHEKCRQVLKCGHICSGNCRNCHEGRLHAACNNNCEAILVCSHACKKTCSTCPPCGKECENRCPHIKCTKLCHEPCEPCKEKCWWKCDHFNCSRSCSEPCDRPPCNEPCQRKLRCNHPCIGLCGEPCPRQCRVCNRNEVDQAGGGAKPNSRYVFLRDCGHIVEVTYLDRYMNTESNEFVMKGCPFCNTPIRHHVRYGNVIKKVLNNIEKVKSHFPKNKIDFKREHLRQMIEDIEEEYEDEKMQKMLILRQGFNNTLAGIYAIENMLRFFDSLKEILDEYERRETLSLNDDDLQIAKQCKKEASMFLQFIKKPRKTLSEQEESDIQNEILRHKAIICMMKCHVVYVTTEAFRQKKLLKDILLSGKPFADEERTKAINSLKILAPWIPGFNERVLDTKLKIIHYPDLRPRCWSVCTKGHVKSSMISEGCVQCEEESQDTLWFSD